MEYLSQHVGVPEQEIATIGDHQNDVLMFKRSGFSIAMGNASDEVKAHAAAVTIPTTTRVSPRRWSLSFLARRGSWRHGRGNWALDDLPDPLALAHHVAEWMTHASGSEKQLESHRREITALFCDLRGFTGFTESADAEDVMALLRDYHAAIGEIIIKYNGTLERYAGDGVMVVFNDPVPVENPALQAVLMALELRNALGALTQTWSRLGHEIGFGIGIAHGFATLGTIGYEGRFDYAAIGTVSNVASRLCDEAKPGQILISARVLTKVENAVKVEPVGEFELKGIRRPLAAYNVVAIQSSDA